MRADHLPAVSMHPGTLTQDQRDARWEDANWMLANGETLEGAARRLGGKQSARSLGKWLTEEARNRQQMVG